LRPTHPRKLYLQLALGSLLAGSQVFAATPDDAHAKARAKGAPHEARETREEKDPSAPAPDNTAVNKRDRDANKKTADQQANDKSDLELVAAIRRAVVDDKALSTNAHNVKIIVEDGHVTLKGPVASRAEKDAVEKKADEVVGRGKGKVTSELTIAP
jgi:hyperosmotically inducible protein